MSGPGSRSVLFVCLGNICRSPLAEAAFRLEAERAGFDARVDSAGTGDWHVGEAPDPRAIAVARANGLDISGYRARQVAAALVLIAPLTPAGKNPPEVTAARLRYRMLSTRSLVRL